MPGSQPSEQRVDQFIVYAAYGQIMHQLQVFELTLWGFLTRSIKNGTTADQAMQRVEKWDATTLGEVVRGLKSQTHWPDGLVDEPDWAVSKRNYLAHHFLREYFLSTESERVKDKAVDQLMKVSTRLTNLQNALETHLSSLGVPGIADLNEETWAELQASKSREPLLLRQ